MLYNFLSLPVLAGHIWPKKVTKPPFRGRIAVQPSLLIFSSQKEISTIYTLPRLWTFQKSNQVNPNTVTAMQRFEIFKTKNSEVIIYYLRNTR